MCGLTGFIDYNNQSTEELLRGMTNALTHRGPDSFGLKMMNEKNSIVGLGHRRLSIIDLSKNGDQPMQYESNSIIFNGEIYNFKEVRKELIGAGVKFETNSDTEVILKAFMHWGTSSVHHFIGMFVYVIYDAKNSELYIFRDRPGVKPLYYYYKDGLFLFGSELKSFHLHPSFHKELNFDALSFYLKYGYVNTPNCIFKHCAKLRPGHYLKISTKEYKIEELKYWDVLDFYNRPKLNIGYDEAMLHTEDLLKTACRYRMVSDVPVGVFLSGGYDSSTVAALLQSEKIKPIETFTIGFEDDLYDEAKFAKKIASHLKTNHNEYYCTYKDAQDIIPVLPEYFDEPFGDSSAIPTLLVSRFARRKVTVSLSADGGDEIFGGYTRYRSILSSYEKVSKIPRVILNPIGKFYSRLPFSITNQIDTDQKLLKLSYGINEGITPGSLLKYSIQRKEKQFLSQLLKQPFRDQESDFDTYLQMKAYEEKELDQLLLSDYKTYLLDDILTKVDRCTMSASLEGREPILDHNIIEFVAQLPDNFKINNRQQKILLKDINKKYIPEELMQRPKQGFGIPIFGWFRKELKPILEYYLSDAFVTKQGIFNENMVAILKLNYLKGDNKNFEFLWFLICFQMWHEKWLKN